MAGSSNVYLKHARYGKDLVRLLRVYKEGDVQHCTELTVNLKDNEKKKKRCWYNIGETLTWRWYRDILYKSR